MRNTLLTIYIALLSLFAKQATATVIVYTDRAAWELAVVTFVTEDFDVLTPADLDIGINSAGRIIVEVTALAGDTSSGKNAVVLDPGGLFDVNGTTYLQLETDRTKSDKQLVNILFGMDAPIIGFGADWNSTINNGQLTVTVGLETINFADYLTGRGDAFLGLVSDTPFSIIKFDQQEDPNEVFGLDDLSIASVISEPATLALVGLGLAGIGYRRHHSKQAV